MISQTMTEWKENDRVTIAGERGVYVVQRTETNKDGSVSLYGGNSNPNGCRGFRDIMPERLRARKAGK